MKISNIKIVYKVVALLLALGTVSIFAAVFSSSKLLTLDTTYSEMTDNDYPSLVATARANRFISHSMSASFAVVAFPDEESIKDAQKMFAQSVDGANKQLDIAAEKAPAKAETFAAFRKEWQSISGELSKGVELGAANKNDEALAVLRPTRASILALQKSIATQIDDRVVELREMSSV